MTSNKIKDNKKGQIFISLTFGFFVLLFSFFFVVGSAKAESFDDRVYLESVLSLDKANLDDTSLSISTHPDYRDIFYNVPNTCHNPYFVVSSIQAFSVDTSLRHDDVLVDKLFTPDVCGSNSRYTHTYGVPANSGENKLTFYFSPDEHYYYPPYHNALVSLFCNVNPDDPILVKDPVSEYPFDKNTLILSIRSQYYEPVSTLPSEFFTRIGIVNNGCKLSGKYPYVLQSAYTYQDDFFKTYTWGHGNYPCEQVIVFNYKASVPDKIFNITFPDNIFTDINIDNDLIIPVSYDYCNAFIRPEDFEDIRFSYSPDVREDGFAYESFSNILKLNDNECSGTKTFILKKEDLRNLKTDIDNTPKFLVKYDFWNALIGKYEYNWQELYDFNYTIAESNTLNYVRTLGDRLDLNINTIAETGFNMPFYYNFTGYTAVASSTVCVHNSINRLATELCYTFTENDPVKGVKYINLPRSIVPHTENIYLKSSLSSTLYSNNLELIWFKPGKEPFLGYMGKGWTNKDFACSQEEWDTPDPRFEVLGVGVNFPAFNFTKIKCYIALSGLNTAEKITNVFDSAVKIGKDSFSNIFPFTLPIRFYDCWKESETAEIPAELAFLNITNDNGKPYFNFPAVFNNGVAKEITFLDADTLSLGSEKTKNNFTSFRTITKYLQWLMFISLIFIIGRDILKGFEIDKITENKQ